MVGPEAKLTMRRQAEPFHLVRPSFGTSRTTEGRDKLAVDQHKHVLAGHKVAKFPRRPPSSVLSGSISLFFLARSRVGLWIAREAEGRTGGIFLFKKSALRFAQQNGGGATMFLAERLELDVENRGNKLIGWIGRVLSLGAQHFPEFPPPLPMLEKRRKSEWL
jgi:hypothetical protein